MNSKSKRFNWELWKLNGLLQKDESFVDAVQGTFNEMFTGNFEIIAEKWECLKQKVQMKALDRSNCLKYEKEMKETNLQKTLQQLIAPESINPGAWTDDGRSTKAKIEQLGKDRYKDDWARAKELVVGEKGARCQKIARTA